MSFILTSLFTVFLYNRNDVVGFDFAVERRGVQAEHLGGAALMSAGDFHRPPNQADLVAGNLVVKRDAL